MDTLRINSPNDTISLSLKCILITNVMLTAKLLRFIWPGMQSALFKSKKLYGALIRRSLVQGLLQEQMFLFKPKLISKKLSKWRNKLHILEVTLKPEKCQGSPNAHTSQAETNSMWPRFSSPSFGQTSKTWVQNAPQFKTKTWGETWLRKECCVVYLYKNNHLTCIFTTI